LLDAIWKAGFGSKSPDGISVPKPVGVISRFQMWFQRKVPGETATRLLPGPEGVPLAFRIAQAIHKLHAAGVPTDRSHSMIDELRILRECLGKVRKGNPNWSARLNRIEGVCGRLAASVPEPRSCGIHRDFYPAQVLVHRERIYLIDFDLYCQGDPALDIGNFVGHMEEQALRELNDARAMADAASALRSRFRELAPKISERAIEVYTLLTLVRHIYLSTQFPERQSFTGPLLNLCETRLGLA
jgi:Ser/Thr protein kinase RdoA (MazF antagonist)